MQVKGNAALILIISAASLLALLGALFSQYALGLAPCELCQYQRLPHLLVVLIGFLAAPCYSKKNMPAGTANLILLIFGVILLMGSALAFYHFGVEKGVFEGITKCTRQGPSANSAEELLNQINGAPIVSCAQAQLELFGISLAGYNGIYSLALALLSFYLMKKVNVFAKK